MAKQLGSLMGWNEPGGGKKDPWGGRNAGQGPPDLDEVVRKVQERLGGLFGGKKGGGAGGGSASGPGAMGIGFILLIALVIWLLSGIYIIDEGTRGVILRFGNYIETTLPGPHWRIPYPVDRVEVVDVEKRRFIEVGYRSAGRQQATGSVPREALMLTEDENIVDIRMSVQYQVSDAQNYLFNVRGPDLTLKQSTESAVREVIGKSKMDFVLTEGRADVAVRTKEVLQAILDSYGVGLLVSNVNLQDAQPPEEVQGAFADAIKAREDEQRQINEAEAYSNEVIPKARGAAARRLEEANAYEARVVARSEGDASRFTQLLAEYEKAPDITRTRLYIDAMQAVLANTNKVMVDVSGGNSLFYLPLDKIVQQRTGIPASMATPPVGGVPGGAANQRSAARDRDMLRDRRRR